jgi:hypothetical protein
MRAGQLYFTGGGSVNISNENGKLSVDPSEGVDLNMESATAEKADDPISMPGDAEFSFSDEGATITVTTHPLGDQVIRVQTQISCDQ